MGRLACGAAPALRAAAALRCRDCPRAGMCASRVRTWTCYQRKTLPHPPPTLAQRHLSGVLGIVLPELAGARGRGDDVVQPSAYAAPPPPCPADWTARGRVAGALALRSVLVLAHGAVASALEAVLTALCTGSRDEDPEVRARALS